MTGELVRYDFGEKPPRKPKYKCFCFAHDHLSKEPIIITTWCSLDECSECVPEWWFAL
jgi:hypothetical protein